MPTVVLSAASPQLPELQELLALLRAKLEKRGETDVRVFDLATTKLAYCQGEFDCWVKTPGVCRTHDAEQAIVQAVHDADKVVLLDAVTFGGHSYTLKRAQDRLICLLSPFFSKRALLTHHDGRYERMPSFYALGWMAEADPEAAYTWRMLADANALNMLAPRVGVALLENASREGWRRAIATMLDSDDVPGRDLVSRALLRAALVEAASGEPLSAVAEPPSTVAVVIGSAKPKGTSTSENLARAMGARFEKDGVRVQYHHATELLHDGVPAQVATKAMIDADLLVLASPLYVDAFPALATRVLERVAAARAHAPAARRPRFAALVNCGFPEAEHIRTALRIARHFALAAGYRWVGALPLGGGGMIKPGVALDAQHGPAEHVKRALDLAAGALAIGENVPAGAIDLLVHAPIPDVVYRMMGDIGWRYQAHQNGLAQAALRWRPLDE